MVYLPDAGSNCAQAFSHSFGSKLAIHRRYTECRFLCILYRYLQSITVRPVPCNYNVIQSVVALSRRKRGFKSRRDANSIPYRRIVYSLSNKKIGNYGFAEL